MELFVGGGDGAPLAGTLGQSGFQYTVSWDRRNCGPRLAGLMMRVINRFDGLAIEHREIWRVTIQRRHTSIMIDIVLYENRIRGGFHVYPWFSPDYS